jgi:hypothetical protein
MPGHEKTLERASLPSCSVLKVIATSPNHTSGPDEQLVLTGDFHPANVLDESTLYWRRRFGRDLKSSSELI